MALLLMDLDNTAADRDAAFGHWARTKLAAWAPGDSTAMAYVIEQDQDGFRPRDVFLAAVRERLGLEETVEELLREYRQLTLKGFPPIDAEVAAKLQSLRYDGWKIAIVSNGEAGVQEATVERVGLGPLIDACVVSGAVGVAKPDPRIFELAAATCRHPSPGAWMIGDNEVDVVGAAAAGMRSVWLTRDRQWYHPDVEPDRVAPSLPAALQIVENDPYA